MTAKEKRKALMSACYGTHCTKCEVARRFPDHTCGRGESLVSRKNGTDYDISDETISAYYNVLFNNGAAEPKKKEPVEADEAEPEKVNHPKHYNRGKIEVIDFIEDQQLDFALGSAVKYICRAGIKTDNPVEDLEKAAWYINDKIKRLKEKMHEVD